MLLIVVRFIDVMIKLFEFIAKSFYYAELSREYVCSRENTFAFSWSLRLRLVARGCGGRASFWYFFHDRKLCGDIFFDIFRVVQILDWLIDCRF
jgi:hypothetical protein